MRAICLTQKYITWGHYLEYQPRCYQWKISYPWIDSKSIINQYEQADVSEVCTARSSGNFSCGPRERGLVSVDSQRGKCEAVVNSNDSSVLSLHRRYVYWLHKPNLPVLDFTCELQSFLSSDKFGARSQKSCSLKDESPSLRLYFTWASAFFSGHTNPWMLQGYFISFLFRRAI